MGTASEQLLLSPSTKPGGLPSCSKTGSKSRDFIATDQGLCLGSAEQESTFLLRQLTLLILVVFSPALLKIFEARDLGFYFGPKKFFRAFTA